MKTRTVYCYAPDLKDLGDYKWRKVLLHKNISNERFLAAIVPSPGKVAEFMLEWLGLEPEKASVYLSRLYDRLGNELDLSDSYLPVKNDVESTFLIPSELSRRGRGSPAQSGLRRFTKEVLQHKNIDGEVRIKLEKIYHQLF